MTSAQATENSAILPATKLEDDFYDWWVRHDEKKRLVASRKDFELVFIGDSITHLFEVSDAVPPRGGSVWNEYYGRRKALDLGFGWDRTQNVLWRLQNGEFDGLAPKLAVLNIGTNNLTGTDHARTNTAEEIVEGIAAICRLIATLSPSTVILVMGIFPRGQPDDALRVHIRRINEGMATLAASRPGLRFMDIGSRFLDPEGRIPVALMNDLTHPTETGYRIWAEAIEPVVRDCVDAHA
jgi:lysophospholipase L1-like esterase